MSDPVPAPTPAPKKTELSSLPNVVRVILGIIASAASVLNVTTFGLGGSAAAYVSAGLAALAYIGIPPLTGNAFQELLLKVVPASWVQTIHGLIGAAIAAVTVIIAQAHWSTGVTAAVLAVVSGLGALGFGPAGTQPVTPTPAPSPTPTPAPATTVKPTL